MHLADDDRLIQYVFPEGPLPVITQVKQQLEQLSVHVVQFQCLYSIFGACKSIFWNVCLQIFLKTEAGQKELARWPQYQGCLVPAYGGTRIQLSTLQYFLLWTAFYVLRMAHASSDITGPRPPQTTRLGHFKQVELQCLCSPAWFSCSAYSCILTASTSR